MCHSPYMWIHVCVLRTHFPVGVRNCEWEAVNWDIVLRKYLTTWWQSARLWTVSARRRVLSWSHVLHLICCVEEATNQLQVRRCQPPPVFIKWDEKRYLSHLRRGHLRNARTPSSPSHNHIQRHGLRFRTRGGWRCVGDILLAAFIVLWLG